MRGLPENIYPAYHAHVYFDAESAAKARRLCTAAKQELDVKVGRFHEKLVGPHPCWSCQIKFEKTAFNGVITWLENRRDQLTIFVHGLTGDDLADHTDHTHWLGEPLPLDLSVFHK